VSHRRLSGWEPKHYTEYIYDSDGRLSGSVETREPEWDTEQLNLLLAAEHLARDVGQHGQLMSESTAPDADPNNYTGGYRYHADGPFTDWAEKAKQDAIDEWKKSAGDDPNMNGMFWGVRRVDDTATG